MIPIDKDVPLPSDMYTWRARIERTRTVRITHAGAYSKYPWRLMLEVGDSFLVQEDTWNMVSNARSAGLRLGYEFTCRAVKGGTRVWRIG